MTDRVLAVHAARPGLTSRGFARSGSYDRLAACVPAGARVLDLACGDGALLARIPGAVGIDLSRDELALGANPAAVCGDARALPFATGAFDVVTCHLAFMLLADLDRVVAELDRVLAPAGVFLAMLGGGPVADPAPDDAFPIFLELIGARAPVVGDPRARSEAGWQALFAGWDVPPWERWPLDLDGDLDEVWSCLAAGYELPDDHDALRAELARRLPRPPIRCRAVTWLARATRR